MKYPQEAESKPFHWISLKTPPRREALTFHASFRQLSGRLEVEIEVLSDYLYVGSGTILLDSQKGAYYAFARRDEQLIIPGTGIKGSVRSIIEAISNSCVRQSTWREQRDLKTHRACTEVKHGQEISTKLCPACRLFGTTGYRGRIHFADAVPVGQVQPQIVKIADLWPPRQGKKRKFYEAKTFRELENQKPERNHRFLEAVPKGARFATILFFENADVDEMGLMLRALGLDRHPEQPENVVYAFPVKIGGAKPRCLGAVCFHPGRISLVPNATDGLFRALAQGGENRPLKPTILEWLQNETLLDQESWRQFRQQAKQQQEPCPKDLY
jgi:CRISPR/Cas system CSM-associated protein Csm3 (group 7 of RAMP superfamily)